MNPWSDIDIFFQTCIEEGVSPRKIVLPNRNKSICSNRWNVFRRMSEKGLTVSRIAKATGFHHTNIIHALRKPSPYYDMHQPKRT